MKKPSGSMSASPRKASLRRDRVRDGLASLARGHGPVYVIEAQGASAPSREKSEVVAEVTLRETRLG